eukprot:CAMPEP_0169175364 /NCGR_PEP_ID=MMETSP1015-20121227/65172_1 /TAXON_ID=342587 /ORGANISM="Karlodinium micrum, Strain CCMP2283" /LENGTH=125 /DNA_ID=CAMNT_0009249549 /DNA_START=121 /DNA_END=499 /DNA_ORIENTATION=+
MALNYHRFCWSASQALGATAIAFPSCLLKTTCIGQQAKAHCGVAVAPSYQARRGWGSAFENWYHAQWCCVLTVPMDKCVCGNLRDSAARSVAAVLPHHTDRFPSFAWWLSPCRSARLVKLLRGNT